MKKKYFTGSQKQILVHIAERLRRQADRLETLIKMGDSKKLAEACAMLHATETQLVWVREGTEPKGA
jgi:hypothetical protein